MDTTLFNKYDATSKLLHWLSALIILWAIISGLSIATLDVQAHWKEAIAEFNVSLTTVYIPFFFWRVCNAIRRRRPDYQNQLPDKQIKVVKLTHRIIYLLTATLLLSGVLMMSTPFNVFGILVIQPFIHDSTFLQSFALMHQYASYLLSVLVCVHVAAVLKHQLQGKKIIQRMC